MKAISSFSGEYRFLSNFYSSKIKFGRLEYPTVEHAYQAAKTLNEEDREIVSKAPTPGVAKRLGRQLALRDDWEKVKLGIMLHLVRVKFGTVAFEDKLLSTGEAELIEGNYWNDTFWGVCRGRGENHLGKILMKVRGERARLNKERIRR